MDFALTIPGERPVAQTRLDPLGCARVIVLGCLERDFCKASKSDSDICVNTILRFGPYGESVWLDSPSREMLPANRREVAAPEPSSIPRLVTVASFSILSCVAVVIWLFALLAIHE
jgi:hypothetical protein